MRPEARGLADLVARAAAADLLPGRHRAEAERIAGPLRLLSSHHLGGDLWILMIADADMVCYPVPAVVANGRVRRADVGEGASEALIGRLASGHDKESGIEFTRWHARASSGERAISADQTNESVIVGENAVVKWTVRSTTHPHPAPHRIAALEAAGFDGMPRPWGVVQWRPRSGAEAELVATVVDLVPDAQDGWDWAVADVRSHLAGDLSLDSATDSADALGALTARMHLALAPGRPARAGASRARGWADEALTGLAEARSLIDGVEGDRLDAHAGTIAATLSSLSEASSVALIPVHGDLHVGQILRSGAGSYLVTDFDGNPVASGTERIAPQPAAVDVAAMMQSLDHVGHVVVRRTPGAVPENVEGWRCLANERFLGSYRRTLAESGRGELLDERLLVPLRLRQICREYVYAARHLPHWRYVPHQAIGSLYGEE